MRQVVVTYALAPPQVCWLLVLVSPKAACEPAGRGRRGSSSSCNYRVWIKMLMESAITQVAETSN